MTSFLRHAALVVLLAPWLAHAQAPAQIDLQKSSIVAGFKQMGVPVDGKFQKFALALQFDPDKPELAQVRFDVDVASFDIGDAAYNQEVRSKTWFNAAAFPKAQFVSSAVRQTAPGRYLVNGKLTIKGMASEVAIPVQFRKDGAQHVYDGVLPIKRLQFNIGEQEWRDTSLVADEVQLKFRIVTTAR
ncbi:MAG: YceI family protein [Burkholderiaceae bacterium]|nr:YceI family protein [Burkholderiaceae bacterium]